MLTHARRRNEINVVGDTVGRLGLECRETIEKGLDGGLGKVRVAGLVTLDAVDEGRGASGNRVVDDVNEGGRELKGAGLECRETIDNGLDGGLGNVRVAGLDALDALDAVDATSVLLTVRLILPSAFTKRCSMGLTAEAMSSSTIEIMDWPIAAGAGLAGSGLGSGEYSIVVKPV